MTVDFVLRRPKVEKQVGLSRSTIYSLMQQGLFPKPISLGPRSRGWLQAEITNWLAERVRQRDEGLKEVKPCPMKRR
jgi:prophage regulatory protein